MTKFRLDFRKRVILAAVVILAGVLTITTACAGSPTKPSWASGNQSALFLTVTQPQDNSTVSVSRVEIKGKTIPGAVVSVNELIAIVDNGGNFSIAVTLEPGPNMMEVVASDQAGNNQEKTLVVTLTTGG